MEIQQDYLERVYAGWLGKIIGVRLGAPIEGWEYEKIRKTLGSPDGYIVDYRDFAADDDTNGPLFFLRTLEDYGAGASQEQYGLTWLNYTPYEHGFYWWGGYGKSTEHTAYLNLRAGIPAPRSGSIAQNGAAVAEQIGGQIFIDTWGLIAPRRPELAAQFAQKAARVSHDGNGVYGGMFIAAVIAAAFGESDLRVLIDTGLSVLPRDCAYVRMARDVIAFYEDHPADWEACLRFVAQHYGYDRYPGTCHIIPNSAVIVLSLLYSEGDFDRALNICNRCGWDTDCNVANVGTIMGVRGGLAAIDEKKWRAPVHDLLLCSSVVGSRNILDIPASARFIARMGYQAAGEEIPEELLEDERSFSFELPGSTHSFRIAYENENAGTLEGGLRNTDEAAADGERSLHIFAKPLGAGEAVKVYYKTYYEPADLHDSRYDPAFSPLFYPGQSIRCKVMIPADLPFAVRASLYAQNRTTGADIDGESVRLEPGVWTRLDFTVPPMEAACIREIGVKLRAANGGENILCAYLDSFSFGGPVDYSVDWEKEPMEVWTGIHREVGSCTYLKGIWSVEDGLLCGSSNDYGELYTGSHTFDNYAFTASLIPQIGENHSLLVRVQGAIRSYAVGLRAGGTLVLEKNDNGWNILEIVEFPWEIGKKYTFTVEARGKWISVRAGAMRLIEFEDVQSPYLTGQVGAAVREGSRCHFGAFHIKSLE